MNENAEKFRKGDTRSRNKEICKLNQRACYLKRRLKEVENTEKQTSMIAELYEKRRMILTIPSSNDMEQGFRRLKYVRYADDFLVGIIGTKEESETIKADITQYMRDTLNLGMSQGKTLITNAQDHAKFLGYEIMSVRMIRPKEIVMEFFGGTSTGM